MLKAFLDRLLEVGASAAAPSILALPGEPKHRYAIALPSGELEFCEAESPPRNHTVRSLDALIAAVKDFAPDTSEDVSCHALTVWYSSGGVTALLDDAARRDTIRFPLTLSPQIRLLESLGTATRHLDQKAFIRLLRVELADCLPPELLGAVRLLKFRQSSQGESTVVSGKASYARTADYEVTGASPLPETLHANVPIFVQDRDWQGVKCAVEINEETCTLALMPLPLEVEKAIQRAEESLGSRLRDGLEGVAGVSVYYGSP
jgi:hypothetical protein